MFVYVMVICSVLVGGVHSMINLADVACGASASRRARVVGGGAAQFAEFPWLASLTRRGGHYCGASVLASRWLLTAAHCMCSGTNERLKPAQVRATLGEYDLSRAEHPQALETRLDLVLAHPSHQCGRPAHDVALLRTAVAMVWSTTVAPACLPTRGDSYAGALATVAGWGWLNEVTAKGGRADVLQKAEVAVLENELCQEWYRSKGKSTAINPGQLCAGREQGGRDSCWADSGGPLMATEGGRSVIIGVVSTGIGCGRPRLPGLYTRLTEYTPWIQEQVALYT